MKNTGPLVLLMAARTLPDELQRDAAWLSFSERARFEQIQSEARRLEYLAARFALRKLLALAHPGTSWQDWALSSERDTAPAVTGGPLARTDEPPRLGLSHSSGLIAAAISSTSIGVDIEVQRKPRPISDLIGMVCSESEARDLHQLPAQAQVTAFYRLWTLKEAFFKSQGTGLDWTIIRSLHTQALLEKDANDANAKTWEGRHGSWPYSLSICTDGLLRTTHVINHTELKTPLATGLWRINHLPSSR